MQVGVACYVHSPRGTVTLAAPGVIECSSQNFSDTIGQLIDSKSHSSPELNPPFRASWCIKFASFFGDAKACSFFSSCYKAGEWLVAALAVRCNRGEWLVAFCVVETVPSATRVT